RIALPRDDVLAGRRARGRLLRILLRPQLHRSARGRGSGHRAGRGAALVGSAERDAPARNDPRLLLRAERKGFRLHESERNRHLRVRRVVLGLTALSEPLHRAGPDSVTVLGASVPRRLSDEDTERLQGAALLPAPWERRIVVTGRDASRFLHNMLTQDVAGMPISAVRPFAQADRKGRPIAEGWIWREEPERFVLRIADPFVGALLDLFDRHRIMERVEWRVPPAGTPFLLVGPRAAAVLGGEAEAGRLPEFGEDACWIRVREITLADRVVFGSVPFATVSAWLPGALPVGWDAFDRARIEAGRAWMGLDVDSERLVPEPGWEDRISYAKGCYLGQETLARLHYQGRL